MMIGCALMINASIKFRSQPPNGTKTQPRKIRRYRRQIGRKLDDFDCF